MRYFLILLFGVIPFLSPAQVVISAKTARYFLEVDDSLQIIKQREATHISRIDSLEETVSQKDKIIVTYQQDSVTRLEENKVQADELKFAKDQIKAEKKAARSAKIKLTLVIIGEAALIILLVL